MAKPMTYFWTMDQLERFHNGYFFNKETMRWWKSRVQTVPPYGGRVFVTSEKMDWKSPRKYSVREIKPDGSISTIGEFGEWSSRNRAHSFADVYAHAKYRREGQWSVEKTDA